MAVRNPRSIRISGIGGQGNVIMGIILADALVSLEHWVVQTQSYGAQVRGGLSFCDVLYSTEPIDYPMANQFGVVYTMHQTGIRAHIPLLKMNGVLIVDTSFVTSIPKEAFRATKKIITKPVTTLAEQKFGTPLPANLMGLGIIAKATGYVTKEALKEAMKKHIREKYHKMNEEAIDYGYSLIERVYKIREERREFAGQGFE